jgi:gamma-glutamyltranspeptidase/glutathione hydrolase
MNLIKTTCILIALCCIGLSGLHAQDRLSGRSFATRSEVLAQNGMAATNHPIASQIALDILKEGGSAVDAAIAANAFLGLADPAMNGIGGDLFAIVWSAKEQKLFGLNASGKSPASLSYAQLKAEVDQGRSYRGGPLSITTPGCVDGWVALHEKFGVLDLARLMAPTVSYARAGIPVTSEVADFFRTFEESVQKSDNPSFKKVFFTDGRFPRKGEILKNPDLAKTLEIIGREGRDGFYRGAVASTIADYVKALGGFLTKEDLANNSPVWVEPVSVNYRGYDVWELPPNGQGISVLQMLNILEGFDMSAIPFGSATHLHHFLEAKKLAFEDMAKFYGDPDFGDIPLEELLSKKYAAERRALIDPAKAGEYDPGLSAGDHTVYLTVADKDGNMVSLIQSLSSGLGSRVVPDGLGFILQNRGSGFVLEEGHINQYAAGKRPFHTIIPAFITKEGMPFVSFGLMGGDMQVPGHVQVVMNLIDFGMNLQEAGDAPRIFHSGTSARGGRVPGLGETFLESGFPYETISELMDKGHLIRMDKGIYGGYQAIMLKAGVYYGASESRKDGQAVGY